MHESTSQRMSVDFKEEGAEVTSTATETTTVAERLASTAVGNLPVAPETPAPAKVDAAGLLKAADAAVEGQSEADKKKPTRVSKIQEIEKLIADPSATNEEISKTIALEMASLLRYIEELKVSGSNDKEGMKTSLEQLKGARELGKQLLEANDAKVDNINFEGVKFAKLMHYIIEMNKRALHSVQVSDHTISNFLMAWRELWKTEEDQVRRDIAQTK